MLTAGQVRRRIGELEDFLCHSYKPAHPPKGRDWASYEADWAKRIREAMRELGPLVEQACRVEVMCRRGAPHKMTLSQRLGALLVKILFDLSNRLMSGTLSAFTLLAGINVSYKTIERLYSDSEVQLALANLHELMLQQRGVHTTNASGDATGYALSVTRHYASTVQRQRDAAKTNASPVQPPQLNGSGQGKTETPPKKTKGWVYAFRLLDLRTRLYVAFGTSLRSERDAYEAALEKLRRLGIEVASIRLDRYYSFPRDAAQFPDAKFYVLPRKNLAHLPLQPNWLEAMRAFVHDTTPYLEQYFLREHSEAAFSADKRITGWGVTQRRYDRIDTAQTGHATWHNLLNLHGPDHPLPVPAD